MDARPLPPSKAAKIPADRKPEWLKIRPPAGENYLHIKGLLRERKLSTVCEEAHCPNVAECWSSGTATFMLGSDTCTRACRFCAVKTARNPPPLDPDEPAKVAESIALMGLHYVVITSVDRDDLEDQASGHFAETFREIKRRDNNLIIEALMPDFRGEAECIHKIVESGVEVYAHNIETVKSLQARVRDPRAGYEQSIGTLVEAKKHAKEKGITLYTKSSIMLGLGETREELRQAYCDLREAGVDVLTLGQYLRPSLEHLPVEQYFSPKEFDEFAEEARTYGFLYVAAGPMVRSSYRAAELFVQGLLKKDGLKKKETENGIQTS